MRRVRLKDLLQMPAESVFDTAVRALLAVVTVVAVYLTLSGIRSAKPAAPETCTCGLPLPTGRQVTLVAMKNRLFYANDTGPIPLDHFAVHFTPWLKQTPSPKVTVTASESALLSDALAVLEETRRHGAEATIAVRHP
jgi:biopolymer transport protein ExbD